MKNISKQFVSVNNPRRSTRLVDSFFSFLLYLSLILFGLFMGSASGFRDAVDIMNDHAPCCSHCHTGF